MRVNAFKLQYFTLLRDVASNSSVFVKWRENKENKKFEKKI